jgi:hypothetical protein
MARRSPIFSKYAAGFDASGSWSLLLCIGVFPFGVFPFGISPNWRDARDPEEYLPAIRGTGHGIEEQSMSSASRLHDLLEHLALIGLLLSCSASAATQSVIANVAFDVPLSLVRDSDINFGSLKSTTSGTYVIDTNGRVTPSSGGVLVGGTPTPGQFTITGSATQGISIGTSAFTADRGVTLSAATCNYDGTLIANCDGAGLPAPGGTGKVLKLGATITADGTQAAGTTAAPAFVLSVVYD